MEEMEKHINNEMQYLERVMKKQIKKDDFALGRYYQLKKLEEVFALNAVMQAKPEKVQKIKLRKTSFLISNSLEDRNFFHKKNF